VDARRQHHPGLRGAAHFEELLGEEGTRRLNEYVVKWAVEEKLADPKLVVADTTVQEAAIPHPNEMGLLATFVAAVVAASKKVGGAVKALVEKSGKLVAATKRKVREYRLFAKERTKAAKDRMVAEMTGLVEKLQRRLGQTLRGVALGTTTRLRKYKKVAWAKLLRLHGTMGKLVPQIRGTG
jgi:hypothetical protein